MPAGLQLEHPLVVAEAHVQVHGGVAGGRDEGGRVRRHPCGANDRDNRVADLQPFNPVAVSAGQPPRQPVPGTVAAEAEDVLDQEGDRSVASPSDEVPLGRVPGPERSLRGIVLPDRLGRPVDRQHGVEVSLGGHRGQVFVPVTVKPLDDHEVRGRPDAAEPIAAVALVAGVVRGQGWKKERPPKLVPVPQVSHQPFRLGASGDPGEKRPEPAGGLHAKLPAVVVDVRIDPVLLVPAPAVDPAPDRGGLRPEPLRLFRQRKLVAHCRQVFVLDHHLAGHVDPAVPVSGRVVHPRTEGGVPVEMMH